MGAVALKLLVAAPPLVEAAVKSKVAFYVAGSALAAWAVVVSVLGLSRPDFPGNPGRARVVMGISVVLVGAAVATAILTATREHGESATAAAPPAKAAPAHGAPSAKTTLSLAADPSGQLAFDKKSLTAQAGSVAIDFSNKSQVPHNVTIAQGSTTIGATQTISSSTATVTANLKPGAYTFYCSVPGHRQAGMQGTLTVH